MRYESIGDAIGGTPLICVDALLPEAARDKGIHLYAKVEFLGPTGSIKDRTAKALIDDLAARGALQPGVELLEPTSGNTGAALAVHAAARGIPITLIMPANVTEERRQFVQALGATIIDSPADQGSNGAVALARAMIVANSTADTKYVMADQYSNEANPRIHEQSTAPEILADLPEVDAVVAGLGTGGTATGLARFFKRAKPSVRVWAAEPMPGEKVTGLRSLEDGFTPEVFDAELLAGRVLVNSRDSISAARLLARRSGILAGPSTGATLVVALRIAHDAAPNSNIVFIACDAGWKYFSAGFSSGDLDEMEDALEGDVFWW